MHKLAINRQLGLTILGCRSLLGLSPNQKLTARHTGLQGWLADLERVLLRALRTSRLLERSFQRADIHEAFLALGCILIGWRFLGG
jgi:hypothetical protein